MHYKVNVTFMLRDTETIYSLAHTHLQVFYKAPRRDKLLLQELLDGRTPQGSIPECPPASSAGLVVQRPPQHDRVQQLVLLPGNVERFQEWQVRSLEGGKRIKK